MNSQLQQSQLPQQQSNIAQEAVEALSLLDPEDQAKVLDYIQALVDSSNNE